VPAPGTTFQYEFAQTLAAPTPIDLATLNADPTCSTSCPAVDSWYPTNSTLVPVDKPQPYTPALSASQIVFVGLFTSEATFVGASAYAAFWAGSTVVPDSYGMSSRSYLVP